mgnify:CR=1 FL=1
MKKTTIPTLGGAMLAATLFFAGPVSAEEWNMATPYPENNFHTQNDIQFAKDVAEATDGKLQITVHSAGSLIAHPEIRNAVRNGTVPLGEILMSMLSNESPVYEVDAIPFLIENYDDAQRLWDASRGQVEDMFAKQNMMVLYSVPWPANGIYTTKPIETASDFNGMKMRVYSDRADCPEARRRADADRRAGHPAGLLDGPCRRDDHLRRDRCECQRLGFPRPLL